MHEETPQFEVRSEQDVEQAVSLAETYLPADIEPVIADNEIVGERRSFEWDSLHRGSVAVRRLQTVEGYDQLTATVVYLNPATRQMSTTAYYLYAESGRFLVSREIDDADAVAIADQQPEDEEEARDRLRAEVMLGLQVPAPGDWDEFMQLLGEGKQSAESEQRRVQTVRKAGRLARVGAFLRSLFRR